MPYVPGVESPFEYLRKQKLREKLKPGRKQRKLLLRETTPNKKNFYSQMNAERVVSYNAQFDSMRFTGSSFNVKLKKQYERERLRQREETAKKFAPELFEAIHRSSAGKPASNADVCNVQKGLSAPAGGVAGNNDGEKRRVHVLSARSKAKVRGKITEFFTACRACKKQTTFLTLTFICECDDGLAVKILNKFLTSIRQEVGHGFNYIRVAERQTNNKSFVNNIHFHLILDRPINIVRFNSLWVLSQYNAGLVGFSRKLGRVLYKDEVERMHADLMLLYTKYRQSRALRQFEIAAKIMEDIKNVSVGRFLNPVDIRKVSSISGLRGYLTKYVTKNNSEFGCLAWSCSRGVSRLFTGAMVPYKAVVEASSEINSYVDKEGELRRPVPYMDEKGMSVSIRIYNRQHFDQYLAEMRTVNKWLLSGEIVDPQVEQYDLQQYITFIHNRN